MKNKLIFTLLVFLQLYSFAQIQNNHWYFGENIGLDFSSGNPVLEYGSNMKSFESSSVISDQKGDLLFYTNGGSGTLSGVYFPGNIWTKNNQIMNNGILKDTLTTSFWFQTSLIIPMPNSTTKYYLFTADYWHIGNKGLKYSIIDISLSNGGTVIQKGIPLLDSLGHGLSAYPCADGINYWLVTNKNQSFYIYKVTQNSVTLSHKVPQAGRSDKNIRFSPDGNYMYCGDILYNFDNLTGNMSLFSILNYIYDVAEFSPNSKVLYATYMGSTGFKLVQYDLTAQDINSSKVYLDLGALHGDIKLGPNGKIYVIDLSGQINSINNPDIVGLNCNYTLNVISLNNLDPYWSFPNTLNSFNMPTSSISYSKELDKQLIVFPNPFDNSIYIEIPHEYRNGSFYMYNIYGQEVAKSIDLKSDLNLNFDYLSNGAYYIKLVHDNNVLTKKIIKE